MNTVRSTFRIWWKKPKRIADLEDGREISFLELFYDLAYVVIIIQLTHTLIGNLSLENIFGYLGIYAVVWFAWLNGTFYHDLHGNNDIRSRIFTFAQMFFLVWMAIFVQNALTPDGYVGFAAAYTGFLFVLTYLWWRTGVHDPDHRPLSGPYSFAYLCTAIAFLVSTQLEMKQAHTIWFVGIAFSLVIPLIMRLVTRRVSDEHTAAFQTIRSSVVERFGLLTIILLGEVFISIVSGATHISSIDTNMVLQISSSLGIVFLLWWVYFDFVAYRKPKRNSRDGLLWMYLHLPLTISIGLVAVGLLNAIESYGSLDPVDRWLIVVPVAAFLLFVSLQINRLDISEKSAAIYRKGLITSVFSAVLILFLGTTNLSVVPLLVFTVLLLALPVFGGFKVWLRRISQ